MMLHFDAYMNTVPFSDDVDDSPRGCIREYSHFQVTWILGMVGFKPLEGYPAWTSALGWSIAILTLVPIPVMAAVQLVFSTGTLTEVGPLGSVLECVLLALTEVSPLGSV